METVNFRAKNLICVCVDLVKDREIHGRMYHLYSNSAIIFKGISGMLSLMEEFFDYIRYPQASTETRSFQSKRGESAQQSWTEPSAVRTSRDILDERGEKFTLAIQVQYRQNATWQGNILWMEREVTQSFRSALELLKLVDSCIDMLEEK